MPLVQFSGSMALFVNVTGMHKGDRVSVDTLRKHVAVGFSKHAGSHSLRKGGALYYARAGAPEDATRQQGGWRTTEIMKTIYTKLARHEVDAALSQVVAASLLQLSLEHKFRALGHSSEQVIALPPHRVQPFLDYVSDNLHAIDEHVMSESKVQTMLKVISKHDNVDVKSQAAHLRATLSSRWMSYKAAHRPKVDG
jgi:hypothetical protein